MKAIRVRVSIDLLEQLMRLPEEMHIRGTAHIADDGFVTMVDIPNDAVIHFIVEHPSLPDVGGALIDLPEGTPTITKHSERLEYKLGDVALGDGRRGL